jgi:hypothetical protein
VEKKRRQRRSLEEIEGEIADSPKVRCETRKILKRFERLESIRINFVWLWDRWRALEQATELIGVPRETFIKIAAFERAAEIIANGEKGPLAMTRELSTDFRRCDLIPGNFRWLRSKLELVKIAAEQMGTDYRTIIEIATYERCQRIISNVTQARGDSSGSGVCGSR